MVVVVVVVVAVRRDVVVSSQIYDLGWWNSVLGPSGIPPKDPLKRSDKPPATGVAAGNAPFADRSSASLFLFSVLSK